MGYINVDITDRVKNDPDQPMRVEMAAIQSGNDTLLGRFYLASGKGDHPAVILLHGFPGIQQNMDWPYFLQQQGFHVLVAHYRGSWGSHGVFTYTHALEDVEAMISFVTHSDQVERYGIDIRRISIVGHGFGGFLALMSAASDNRVASTAALSPYNLGRAAEFIAGDKDLHEKTLHMLNHVCPLLKGASGESLIEEAKEHAKSWDLTAINTSFKNHPLLLTAATRDLEAPVAFHHEPLYESLIKKGEQVDVVKLDTDHHYLDKRETMAQLLLSWLNKHT